MSSWLTVKLIEVPTIQPEPMPFWAVVTPVFAASLIIILLLYGPIGKSEVTS